MKLCTFAVVGPMGTNHGIGVADDEHVIDLTASRIAMLDQRLPSGAASRIGLAEVPPDMIAFLGIGDSGLDWAREASDFVRRTGIDRASCGRPTRHPRDRIVLKSPVLRPPGIACFASWKAHLDQAAEKGFNLKFPDRDDDIRPYYKGNPDSVVGPDTVVEFPPYADELDVECEIAAIVGRGGKNLAPDEAEKAIVGYTIFNDISIREVQTKEMRIGLGPTKGKDLDGGNILGPWIVTRDELGDPRDLTMALHVNGEEWSSYKSKGMAWSFADLLSYLSRGQRVHPGHVLTSGSYPGGSGLDLNRKLRRGDKAELRVSGIGALACTIGQ
jgi:2-keto-4-pentenoate hydratase/2-oxohepta-3-ene-1,7-dioic acid hydratase in catechol pathway